PPAPSGRRPDPCRAAPTGHASRTDPGAGTPAPRPVPSTPAPPIGAPRPGTRPPPAAAAPPRPRPRRGWSSKWHGVAWKPTRQELRSQAAGTGGRWPRGARRGREPLAPAPATAARGGALGLAAGVFART